MEKMSPRDAAVFLAIEHVVRAITETAVFSRFALDPPTLSPPRLNADASCTTLGQFRKIRHHIEVFAVQQVCTAVLIRNKGKQFVPAVLQVEAALLARAWASLLLPRSSKG